MPSRRAWLRTLLGATLPLALGGCGGWYLRGTRKTAISGKQFYVTPLTGSFLYNYYLNELTYAGVGVVYDRAKADAIVDLKNEVIDRRVLSVDPATGKVREIEIGLQVQLEVRAFDGTLLLAPEKFTWYQDYVFDEASVLGTQEVEQNVRVQLEKDASRSLVLRLESIDPKKFPARAH